MDQLSLGSSLAISDTVADTMHYFIAFRIHIVTVTMERSLRDARVVPGIAMTFASVTASSIKAICVMNFAAGMVKKNRHRCDGKRNVIKAAIEFRSRCVPRLAWLTWPPHR